MTYVRLCAWQVCLMAHVRLCALRACFVSTRAHVCTRMHARLPMTVAFMSAFSLVVNQYLTLGVESSTLLWTLVVQHLL